MKRKVVQIAGFTKVISLPSQWVKKHGVQKGDELEVTEQDTTLLISCSYGNTKILRAHLNASKLDKYVIWPILSLVHKTGYNEIKITGIDKEKMRIIHDKVASSLLGFEVIEQTSDYCIVKNIAEGTPANLQSVMRKIFLVTMSQARQTLEFVKTGDDDIRNEVLNLENTNDKLTNFSERLLNDEAITLENRYKYFIVWILENIGDSFKHLCRALKDEKKLKTDPEVAKIFNEVNDLLERYYNMYYKFSLPVFSEFSQVLTQTQKKLNTLLKKKKGTDSVILTYLTMIAQSIHDSVGATIYLKADLDGKLTMK